MTSEASYNEEGEEDKESYPLISKQPLSSLSNSPLLTSSSSSSSINVVQQPPTLEVFQEESIKEQYSRKSKEARNTMIGMVCVALAALFICSTGAVVQYVEGSVLELLLGRYIFQNIFSWIIWFCKRPAGVESWYGDPPYRFNIWIRGCFYWILIFCWWRGLELVPIGDAEVIFFISPITTVLAARFWLKEKLPKMFPITFILTIIGVVCICKPAFVFGTNTESISILGLCFIFGSVIAWTIVCILVRTAKAAHWIQLELVSSTQGAWLWTPLLIFGNRVFFHSKSFEGGEWNISVYNIGMMMLMAAMGFAGLLLSVIGYQIGDATKVAWMEYLDLVFAFIYQWLYFKEEPDMWEFIGASLLLCICVIHVCEEFLKWRKHSPFAANIKEEHVKEEHEYLLNNNHNNNNDDETTKLIIKQRASIAPSLKHIDEHSNEQNHEDDNHNPSKKLSHKERLINLFERLTKFSSDVNEDSASEYEQIHR